VIRRPGNEAGQSLIEFALASTVLFMTLFGIFGCGIAVFRYNMLANLSKEAVRYAAVRGASSNTSARVSTHQDAFRNWVRSRSVGLNPAVSVTWPDGNDSAGNRVQVQVTSDFTPMTLLVPHAVLHLESTAQLVIVH
jgi:Flp pilus assembly protein TadG